MLIAIWSVACHPWLPMVDNPLIMTRYTAALAGSQAPGAPTPSWSEALDQAGNLSQSCNAGPGDWRQLKLRWDQFSVSWIFKQFSHCWHWPCARPANFNRRGSHFLGFMYLSAAVLISCFFWEDFSSYPSHAVMPMRQRRCMLICIISPCCQINPPKHQNIEQKSRKSNFPTIYLQLLDEDDIKGLTFWFQTNIGEAKEPDIKLLSDALRGNQSSLTSPPAKCCASCFCGWLAVSQGLTGWLRVAVIC